MRSPQVALFALAVGAFGIGSTEFVMMATILAGLWSLMSGTVVLLVVRTLGL